MEVEQDGEHAAVDVWIAFQPELAEDRSAHALERLRGDPQPLSDGLSTSLPSHAALWYVGIRIIEGATYVLGMVSTPSLLGLSGESVAAAGGAPLYPALRAAAVAESYWAAHMATIAFILGAIAFYLLLYRSRLVPPFISVWGLIAVALLTSANVVAPDLSQGFEPAMLMYLPIAANEVFLAFWLIVKGFHGSAIDRPIHSPQLAIPASSARVGQ